MPIDLTAEALRAYLESRKLPDLPVNFPDQAGRLMEGTQYTLTQLNETINRLERVSDSDDLTGIYNRRAGEKRLTEEIARAERDLESFQVAFFDLNGFKDINARRTATAPGDACISHVAALLQLNTRRGDWVARWGADEFIVGLHRNRALKQVMERIVAAIGASPCEIAPGQEMLLTVSVGVAEYRFGAGKAGLLADADRAMFEAKHLAKDRGGSHDLLLPRGRHRHAGAAGAGRGLSRARSGSARAPARRPPAPRTPPRPRRARRAPAGASPAPRRRRPRARWRGSSRSWCP